MSELHPNPHSLDTRTAGRARSAPRPVLVTGSAGLIGTALRRALELAGAAVEGLDLLGTGTDLGDVRDADRVRAALRGCHGVVHLAAVSRIVRAEREPDLCWSTNVGGLRNVLEAALRSPHRPWVIFASSREVYGEPDVLPATESTPLRPVNVYGRSKLEGERLVDSARRDGLRAAVVRLSNVYGSTRDHADRVVPAFAQAAVLGRELRVEGADRAFDFTHLDDVTRGLLRLVDLLDAGGETPPPIQLATGRLTTLGDLARLTVELARSPSAIREAPPRTFDVARFCGSPDRARALLGWAPRVSLEEGLARLLEDFRAA